MLSYTEKLDILVRAIIDAIKNNRTYANLKNISIFKLDVSMGSGLAFIGRKEALKILEKLQFNYGIIELLEWNYPSRTISKTILGHYEIDEKTGKKTYIPIENPQPIKTSQPDPNAIYLCLKPEFENWHYLTMRTTP